MRGLRTLRTLARAALALWLLAPGLALGQIYAGSDATTGAVVLSNFRSEAAVALVEGTTPPIPPAPALAKQARDAPVRVAMIEFPSVELRSLVETAAARNKLSPALVDAVIVAESRYDTRAVSAKGAIGLMQLMPATGKRFGAVDLFSAEQNVAAGASYLSWLMALFDGRLELVLAAYNAGEQAVINAGCRVPAYPQTQAYVKKILRHLRAQAASDSGPPARTGDAPFAVVSPLPSCSAVAAWPRTHV
jgi:soluble lytic murein transglycosylase-like protein